MSMSTPPASGSAPVLVPVELPTETLEYDLRQRYTAAVEILDRMLASAPPPARVLELGPNFLNPLPLFLDPARVRLTRADVNPVSNDPDFVLLPADGPLPFGDDSFDAVLALDVLEHMPAERRRGFVAECLRVARHGAIFSCPNAVPEVEAAEGRANEAYRARHGVDHPWLEEHRRFGLPREEDMVALLRELDRPHAVFDNSPLDAWLPMLLLCENLSERHASDDLHRRLNAAVTANPVGAAIPYRKIYAVAKSFDATAALEARAPAGTDSAAALDALAWLGTVSAEALTALERNRRNERVAVAAARKQVELELDDLRAGVSRLEARLRESEAAGAGLRADLRYKSEELKNALGRHHLMFAHMQASQRSLTARVAGAVGAALRLVFSRRLDARDLIPWNDLEREPTFGPNAWRVIGRHAYFLVPRSLPAGWLHFRLHMNTAQIGQAEVSFDPGDSQDAAPLIERIPVHGRGDRSCFVYLPKPVVGFRFCPLDVTGKIELERLEIRVPSLASLAWHAVLRKIDILRNHGLLERSVRNAFRLMLRGQFLEVYRKLRDGLVYRNRRPPNVPVVEPPSPAGVIEEMPKDLDFAPAGNPAIAAGKRLDIVYVLRSAGLCGGVKVVLEHTSRLYARGHNVCVYYLEGNPAWFPWRVPTRRFGSIDALRHALRDFRGIKVATWYETAPWVAESLQQGDRGYYLVQDIEDSYSDTPEQADAARRTYSLGLRAITEGTWVRQQLRERFNVDSVFVSIGLDHDRFRPQVVLREPQRILTQLRTWSGGVSAGARIKGWDTARDTVVRCFAANPRTTLTTFSIEEAQTFPHGLEYTHYQTPVDEKLAELYGQAGIYLLTSRHEGFGLTAAEAMACGCPVVATQAQGNEEFCIDGVTALTAAADDVDTLARHCLRLQSDPAFARQIGKAGQEFIRQYTWDRVIDRLEREFLEREGPEVVIEKPVLEVAQESARMPLAPSSTGSCCRGHEYPDLRLRGSSFVDWSIVIPTIGKPNLVAECVASCRRFIPDGVSVQFIVVDDGSSDPAVIQGLRAAAREHDFQLLFNRQNLGFSATVNRGMRKARGRYLVLCNNDVVFYQPWLEPLQALFERDPHVGIVGARLLYPDGTIQHAGMDKAPQSLNWFHTYGKLPGDHPEACQTRYVWGVTGALFAIRRSVLERLGGLSTAYGTAYEDLDYCLYAWANGVRVAYAADVSAYHLEGHTRGVTEEQKRDQPLWAERERAGRAYFERKWAFLRHVEDFKSLLSLMDRAAQFPVFAEELEQV